MNKKALILGAAVAGLMATAHAKDAKKEAAAPSKPAMEAGMGECHGVNACKGHGACGGEGHECAGKNSCKGKGWVSLSEADCKAKKGTWKHN